MPLYEWRCRVCGDYEEYSPRISVDLQKLCIQCKIDIAERLVSVPAMRPDDTWSDGVTSLSLGKTFASKSEMREYKKRNGIEDAGRLDRFGSYKAKQEKEKRIEKEIERSVADSVSRFAI